MSISRKSFLVLQGNLVTKLLGIIGMSLVAHLMGPGPIGMIAFAYAFIGLFDFIFDPGLSTAHIKIASEKKDFGYCVGTYLSLKVISAAVATLVLMGALFWTIFIGDGFDTPGLHKVVLIILVSKIIENIFMYPLVSFTATQEMAKRTTIKFLKSFSDLIFVATVALFYRNVYALASTHVLTEIVIAAGSLYLFKGYPLKKPRRSDYKRYIKFSLPLIGISVVGILSRSIDKIMIQAFWGSIQVGQYHCASRATEFMLILSASLLTVLIPIFSNMHAKGKFEEIKLILEKAEKYMMLLIGPLLMFIFAFARPLVILFLGKEFAMSVPIMRILCVSTLGLTLIRPINSLIVGIGKVKWIFWLTCFLVGTNFILNMVFIPDHLLGMKMIGLGALGAAVATAITRLSGVGMLCLLLRKKMKFNPVSSSLIKSIIPIFIVATLFIYIVFPVTGEDIWVLSFVPIALLIYVGLLKLLGEFGKPEITLILAAANPKKLKSYIKNEFTRGEKLESHT